MKVYLNLRFCLTRILKKDTEKSKYLLVELHTSYTNTKIKDFKKRKAIYDIIKYFKSILIFCII